jgi:hypothetical protein
MNSALAEDVTRDGGGEAGMEKPTTDDAGNKGLEEAAPASIDANDSPRTGGVDAGTGSSVGVGPVMDVVGKFSLISGSARGATISRCVVPSRGRNNKAAGGISCSAETTLPVADASVGRGLE